MEKLKSYVLESYHELKTKVSWPTWEELQETALITIIALVILSLVVYAMDVLCSSALGVYYNAF